MYVDFLAILSYFCSLIRTTCLTGKKLSYHLADEGEVKLMLILYQCELGNNICLGFLEEGN